MTSLPSQAGTDMPDIRRIPLDQIHESPLNTRTHFDLAKLDELAASMRTSKQLTPVLVRPSTLKGKSGFELAAGHRRRRAAPLAGLDSLLVIVREMDDRTFLEVLSVDNLQREDVHPLEEAQGYRNLLTLDGYNPKLVADRVGKSESYVYDRLKLLQLIPAAQELFLENRVSLGHAIILARVGKDAQQTLIDDTGGGGGLWRLDHGHATLDLAAPGQEKGKYAGLIPISVRQLQQWIDAHVRFDASDVSVPQLFPDTAAMLAQAEAKREKVVPVTYDFHVHPDAKDDDGARTYGPTSWKRADGQPGSPGHGDREKASTTCEHSVIGLVAAGEHRGESFRVCIDKKRCTVHWGTEIRERNKRERERGDSSSKPATVGVSPTSAAANARRAEMVAAREAELKRLDKATPAILTAIARAVKAAPSNAASPIAKYVWEMLADGLWGIDDLSKKAAKYLARGISSSDLLCHIVMCSLVQRVEDASDDLKQLVDDIKTLKLGVDVVKIMDAVAPKAAPAAPKRPEPKKAPAKKTATGKALRATHVVAKSAAQPAAEPKKKAPRKRGANEFMKPMQPDAALAAIVGDTPLPRTEVTRKLWAYISEHKLQDAKERRTIIADAKLKAVFGGKAKVSMFEMTKHVNKHLAEA